MQNTFSSFLSPFSWRYSSLEMRYLFSEEYKYKLWRKIWLAIAQSQMDAGLVSKKEYADLKKHVEYINISRILEIEKDTKHDVVAAIKEYAEKATVGGGKIHLGATSMDIVDNADMLRLKEALLLIERKLCTILELFAEKIEQYKNFPCIGYTHLQPAEPTTVGYRFAFYAQDILIDYQFIQFLLKNLKTKGLKGAVGTAASYHALFQDTFMSALEFEEEVLGKLGIDAALISTQVNTRKFDYLLLSCLSSIASSIAKFAGDLRILQSPQYGEWAEPFGKKQVGSSAMPFKKNPLNSEKICSLARYIASLPAVALENATLSYLERTLDDSANKRIIMPNAFLAVDEIVETAIKIIPDMFINEKRISFNLSQYAPFAASEAILLLCVKKGADRQKIHEILRIIALASWDKVQNNEKNPMEQLIIKEKTINKLLSKEAIQETLTVEKHIGNAPARASIVVKQIEKIVHEK